MHAASVHPEPGSNSLKFVYYPLLRLTSLPERFGSLLVRVSLNSKEFSESSFFVYQKRFVLLFNFQRALRCLPDSLYIISPCLSFVKRFFKVFSTFFSRTRSPSDSPPIIHLLHSLVNSFLYLFYNLPYIQKESDYPMKMR